MFKGMAFGALSGIFVFFGIAVAGVAIFIWFTILDNRARKAGYLFDTIVYNFILLIDVILTGLGLWLCAS